MRRMMFCLFIVGAITFLSSPAANAQMQIYGAWHCGNDACTWASVRNMTDFDTKNHWLIDRGDGSGLPSVNLVVLSFVQPLKLLNKTTDSGHSTAESAAPGSDLTRRPMSSLPSGSFSGTAAASCTPGTSSAASSTSIR